MVSASCNIHPYLKTITFFFFGSVNSNFLLLSCQHIFPFTQVVAQMISNGNEILEVIDEAMRALVSLLVMCAVVFASVVNQKVQDVMIIFSDGYCCHFPFKKWKRKTKALIFPRLSYPGMTFLVIMYNLLQVLNFCP